MNKLATPDLVTIVTMRINYVLLVNQSTTTSMLSNPVWILGSLTIKFILIDSNLKLGNSSGCNNPRFLICSTLELGI